MLAPGEVNRTIDAGLVTAAGNLALGDQVWMDTNNNGIFEPQNGEMGIDGVRLDLYLDANNDGLPTLDEYAGTHHHRHRQRLRRPLPLQQPGAGQLHRGRRSHPASTAAAPSPAR